MSKDLRSFLKKKKTPGKAPDMEFTSEQKMASRDIEKKVDELSQQSPDELMGNLMKSVEQGKEDGSFTSEKLSEFVRNVSPMLNEEQKQRLAELTKNLDK